MKIFHRTMDRIVDIATDKVHLSAHRGLLIVNLDHDEIGWVALDDIAAVIVHAHGVTWTTSLVVKLAERGAMMVLCRANHAPVALEVRFSYLRHPSNLLLLKDLSGHRG